LACAAIALEEAVVRMKSKLGASTVLLVCLGLAWLAGPVDARREARILLAPETLALAPGGTAVLEIRVEEIYQLAGAEVHLVFGPSLLEVVDADPVAEGTQIDHGDFLSPDYVVRNVADPSSGTIDYAIACMPLDKAVSGSGTLARVTFYVLAEGEVEVKIRSALLADVQSEPIPVEVGPGVIVTSRSGSSLAVWAVTGLIGAAVAAGFVAVVWRAVRAR